MHLPAPIAAINEHSCALACLAYLLAIYQNPVSQEDLIEKYRDEFPKWKNGDGILSRGDIINLAQLEGVPFRRFFSSPSWAEVREAIGRNGGKTCGGFILTRKNPLNHCYFLIAEDPDKKIRIMRPNLAIADIGSIDPDSLALQTDCDFLVLLG